MATRTQTTLEAEYRVLREGAGLVERRGGLIEISGPDAADYLQGQVTNDVAALKPGQGCYALLLNPKGRIVSEMIVLSLGADRIWIQTEQDEDVLPSLQMYTIGRAVEVNARSSWIASLIGPRTGEVLGIDIPATEHSFVELDLGGIPVVAAATNMGVDLTTETSAAATVRGELIARGAAGIEEQAAEILRIESGRPRYELDMSADNLPGELGLEQRAVSFTKGCYVGQEPVARMHHRGHPNRHLRGLRLTQPAAAGAAIVRADAEVGSVASTAVSPSLGPIALAVLRREVGPGDTVEVGPQRSPARIVALPFARDE